ncbi:hypothetical protein EDD85DRAFT_22366 [Armillaria nabsnona]|nr:hypothetical protein EDD85DRAFT_22366 [Armillaria nabsnona]
MCGAIITAVVAIVFAIVIVVAIVIAIAILSIVIFIVVAIVICYCLPIRVDVQFYFFGKTTDDIKLPNSRRMSVFLRTKNRGLMCKRLIFWALYALKKSLVRSICKKLSMASTTFFSKDSKSNKVLLCSPRSFRALMALRA